MTSDTGGSVIESVVAVPTAAARAAQQIRATSTYQPHPDDGEWQLPSPVDWHDLHGPDADAMLAMLADFLTWAVPRWGFTTDQFPYGCWWQHDDIVEEMTAWWGMWIGYIHNPDAHPADPTAFHERTWNLKQRLATTYRGRCRHAHEEQQGAAVSVPADSFRRSMSDPRARGRGISSSSVLARTVDVTPTPKPPVAPNLGGGAC